MANHTFGGVRFYTEQQDGTSVPIWPEEDVLVVEHIDGSDDDIVHHLGKRGTQEVAYALSVESADWASFRALRGQTLTLALIGNATRLATLKKLENVRWHESAGKYRLTATFLG